MEEQVVSRQRVADHGEVYTRKREVNAMLGLVGQETERIESRFLEPACGTGNFLAEILTRKLRVVESRYKKSQLEYERNAAHAVSSIYGIEILEDNVVECRKRLYDIMDQNYTVLFSGGVREGYRKAVRYILRCNIIWGDALTLRTVDADTHPIVFAEWSFPLHNSKIKRRDYIFGNLIPNEQPDMPDLFSKPELISDLNQRVFLPEPVREYSLTHFLKVADAK